MSRLDKLLPASWKGIPFLVRSEILSEGGRRIVLHDYPNSSERYVEDQGELPPRFSVTAFVSGEDFLDRAGQLERALQEPGKGSLSMPTFGSRKLFAMPYSKDASQTSVGEIKFKLEFVAGRAVSGPSRAPSTPETVYSQGDIVRRELALMLEELWLPPADTSNVVSAQFDLEQVTKAIELLTTDVDNIGDVASIGKFILANSPSIVRSGYDMAETFVRGLWQTVSEGLSGGDGSASLHELTKFGSQLTLSLSDIKNATIPVTSDPDSDEIPLWAENTAKRIARNDNRLTLVNASRIAALVAAYEQASDSQYATDAEIEQARGALERDHQRLLRVDTHDKTLIQSQPTVRGAIETLRLSALEVLDQKEQSVHTLTTIVSGVPTSAFVLAYDLYAEEFTTSEELTARGVELRELNPQQAADKLSGGITVLQS